MASDEYNQPAKIVLIGDSGVGKTQIVQRYTRGTFDNERRNTIGVDFPMRSVRMHDKVIRAQMWEVMAAGQRQFLTTTGRKNYYRGAAGVLLVYDITSGASFKNCQSWLAELRASADDRTCITLVGNKTDLQDERQVPADEGQQFAEENGLMFFETSALDGRNIETVFHNIIEEVYLKSTTDENDNTVKLQTAAKSTETATRTCCRTG